MRVAVTGAGGRLGRALLDAASQRQEAVALPWRRPEYDLDGTDPTPLLERDRPHVVVHAAAWTDVDGCAREPELAYRRNAHAVRTLADACAVRSTRLVVVSTNEVFDGRRADGRGYAELDPTGPLNPYGASKLAGEEAAGQAFDGRAGLWIARTAWLYGAPGNDFPNKIIAAADRRALEEALPVVADEVGSPTSTRDLAEAILDLIATTTGGVYHLVNDGAVSRLDWARAVLEQCRPGRQTRPISRADIVRDSTPPAWAVLDGTRASVAGVRMRGWRAALDDYLVELA